MSPLPTRRKVVAQAIALAAAPMSVTSRGAERERVTFVPSVRTLKWQGEANAAERDLRRPDVASDSTVRLVRLSPGVTWRPGEVIGLYVLRGVLESSARSAPRGSYLRTAEAVRAVKSEVLFFAFGGADRSAGYASSWECAWRPIANARRGREPTGSGASQVFAKRLAPELVLCAVLPQTVFDWEWVTDAVSYDCCVLQGSFKLGAKRVLTTGAYINAPANALFARWQTALGAVALVHGPPAGLPRSMTGISSS